MSRGKFAEDLVGKVFGKIIVIKRAPNKMFGIGRQSAMWVVCCKCNPDQLYEWDTYSVKNRTTCKVCSRPRGKDHHNYKHGLQKHPLFSRWSHMKERCNRPKNPSYKHYGGRGIKVCDEWNNNFQTFYDWAIQNGYKKELQLDRIDVNGGYSPENCRFITQKENCRNKRNNKYFEYNGEKLALSALMEKYGVTSEGTFQARLDSGWSIDEAITIQPNETKERLIKYNEQILPISMIWEKYGKDYCNYKTFHKRIQKGWDIEKALTTKPLLAPKVKLITYNGETDSMLNICTKYGVCSYAMFVKRIRDGWITEKALLTPMKELDLNIEYKGESMSLQQASERFSSCDYKTVFHRYKYAGWTLEQAIEFPAGKSPKKIKKNSLVKYQ